MSGDCLQRKVVGEATPSGKTYHAEIRLEHPIQQSCWIAAQAFEDIRDYRAKGLDFSKVHSEEGTLLGNYYGTRRPETVFAHTSPVYVIQDNEPIRNWDDAQYYIRFMDSAIQWLKTEARFASQSDKQDSINAFLAGRTIYERRAEEARRR
jgi:hypothetical protein